MASVLCNSNKQAALQTHVRIGEGKEGHSKDHFHAGVNQQEVSSKNFANRS